MCQRTPFMVIIACIGFLLNCCLLPVSLEAQLRRGDRLLYRITITFNPPAYLVTEKIYQLTVLQTSKHEATIACTLLHANDSTRLKTGQYHFVSSDPSTWHAWSTETASQMALLYHPVILTVRNNDSIVNTQGITAIVEAARLRWSLPPEVAADLRWRIPVQLTADMEKLFRCLPAKMEAGYQWYQGFDSCRVEVVTPETVSIYRFPGFPNPDGSSYRESSVYTLLRNKGVVDKLVDTLILEVEDPQTKQPFVSTSTTNIQLLPVDTQVPVTDTARFNAQVWRGAWQQITPSAVPKK
ncbi:hypothetical protein [Chitinophaga flava]|uniref:Uncharacterized protein n=1 Tax=Chitinophaga flava TaxID=2259036 RepID=A0A365Y5U5_9BACT|nr:hypothetical protein [Chitinophaga flava]RBL93957.1 hypothetical protein DF182_15850 [Chitinophaga flava]